MKQCFFRHFLDYVLKNISAQVRQVSEAVCPVVDNALAKSIMQALNQERKENIGNGSERDEHFAAAIP